MRRKCPYCRKYFKPNPKLGSRQKTCSSKECRKANSSDYMKKWWAANKEEQNPRYEYTKHSPSRQPEHRAAYQKKGHVKRRQAAYMRRYRKRKRLERGKSVRCTNCDIDLIPHQEGDSAPETDSLRVRCTKTDISISLVSMRNSSNMSNRLWGVRCTKIDGL